MWGTYGFSGDTQEVVRCSPDMTELREILSPEHCKTSFLFCGVQFLYISICGNFLPVKPYADKENIFSDTKNQPI